MAKYYIMVGAVIFYLSILSGIYFVAKIFPRWDQRQKEKNK